MFFLLVYQWRKKIFFSNSSTEGHIFYEHSEHVLLTAVVELQVPLSAVFRFLVQLTENLTTLTWQLGKNTCPNGLCCFTSTKFIQLPLLGFGYHKKPQPGRSWLRSADPGRGGRCPPTALRIYRTASRVGRSHRRAPRISCKFCKSWRLGRVWSLDWSLSE